MTKVNCCVTVCQVELFTFRDGRQLSDYLFKEHGVSTLLYTMYIVRVCVNFLTQLFWLWSRSSLFYTLESINVSMSYFLLYYHNLLPCSKMVHVQSYLYKCYYSLCLFPLQFKAEMVDTLYNYAKFQYECGNYSAAAEYLYFVRILVCSFLIFYHLLM